MNKSINLPDDYLDMEQLKQCFENLSELMSEIASKIDNAMMIDDFDSCVTMMDDEEMKEHYNHDKTN